MNAWVKALAPLLLFALVGCRAGPAPESLRADLQNALEQDFHAGVFDVTDYSRKGVFPYVATGDERDRLLVYYDAELTFKTDQTLTDSNTIGVGALLGVLGATPLGVTGVETDGNHKGDVLDVYGATSYASEEGTWVRLTEAPPEVKGASEVTRTEDIHQGLDLTSRQRQLSRLEKVGATLERSRDDAKIAAFDTDLSRFVALSECRLAVGDGRPAVATGLPFGEYGRFGGALAEVLDGGGTRACILPTDGSIENVARVAEGDVSFGVVQSDVAAMARDSHGLFAGRTPVTDLRAVCALFPEAIQIVARDGVASAADLKGHRVGIGPMGSGTRASATRVLDALGIPITELSKADGRATGHALDALVAGELDAVFVTGAWPLGGISKRAAAGGVTLLSLPAEVVTALVDKDPSLVAVTLPANTYPGLRQPCATVAVTATLVTRKDVDDALVSAVLKAAQGHVSELAGQSSHAWYVSRDTAKTGVSIPLHPAAERLLSSPR